MAGNVDEMRKPELMADELSDVAVQLATRPGSASRGDVGPESPRASLNVLPRIDAEQGDKHNEDLVDSQEWAFVEQACVL